MRFKNGPQLPGAGRTRAGHHHGSHSPTSPATILLGKMAYHTKQIHRQCIIEYVVFTNLQRISFFHLPPMESSSLEQLWCQMQSPL